MAVKTLNELFEHELKDIYYAEHRLVEALTELAGETRHREIKRAYTTHKKETQGQIKRLKQVFKMIGDVPEAEKCPGIEGLLKEKQNFTRKEKPSQEILDYYNLGAASKTERYEITAYEGLIEIARQLGLDDAVELLAANLQEEEATLELLKTLSEGYDTGALMAEEDEEPASTSSSKGGASKRSAGKGAAKSSTSRNAAGKSSAGKGRASQGASKSGGASTGGASKDRSASRSGAASRSTVSSTRGAARDAGNGIRTTAGLRGNDAGAPPSADDDAGYRGEVEADDIMVAPDPVVTAGER